MPLKNVMAVSICCDGCNREWSLTPLVNLRRELLDASDLGWVCLKSPEGDPVLCPHCREEVERG